VHEAHPVGLGGVDRATGDEQVAGPGRAHDGGEPGDVRAAQEHAELRRRDPEPGSGRDDPEVAGDGELQTGPQRVPVDRRDDGHRQRDDGRQQLLEGRPQRVAATLLDRAGRRGRGDVGGAAAEIGPGAEGGSLPVITRP